MKQALNGEVLTSLRPFALQRIGQLESEIRTLEAAFPDLRRSNGAARSLEAPDAAPTGRKRRKLSKEARQRISAAQTARWAAERAKKEKEGKPRAGGRARAAAKES